MSKSTMVTIVMKDKRKDNLNFIMNEPQIVIREKISELINRNSLFLELKDKDKSIFLNKDEIESITTENN